MDIITYLLNIIQNQHQQICWLILFISRYIPLKQWAHDELHSPKYQKFLTDKLPIIKPFVKQDWMLWHEYYLLRYGMSIIFYAMANFLNLSKRKKVKYAMYLSIPSALFAALPMNISTITTALAVSLNAKSVDKSSSTAKISLLL